MQKNCPTRHTLGINAIPLKEKLKYIAFFYQSHLENQEIDSKNSHSSITINQYVSFAGQLQDLIMNLYQDLGSLNNLTKDDEITYGRPNLITMNLHTQFVKQILSNMQFQDNYLEAMENSLNGANTTVLANLDNAGGSQLADLLLLSHAYRINSPVFTLAISKLGLNIKPLIFFSIEKGFRSTAFEAIHYSADGESPLCIHSNPIYNHGQEKKYISHSSQKAMMGLVQCKHCQQAAINLALESIQ